MDFDFEEFMARQSKDAFLELAKIVHDAINEICANDDKTNENLKLLQGNLNKLIGRIEG